MDACTPFIIRPSWPFVFPVSIRCGFGLTFRFTDLSDPLKLKARQFSRGGSTASRGQPNNLWTETPAERQQRIADEVAGKKRRAANAEDASANPEDDRKRRRRDEEIRQVVEEHNVRVTILSL